VLNGADGLGQLAAGLVGQGLSIFEAIKSNLGEYDEDNDTEDDAAGRPQLSGSDAPPAREPHRGPVDRESDPQAGR
jgi:hypothetical protein